MSSALCIPLLRTPQPLTSGSQAAHLWGEKWASSVDPAASHVRRTRSPSWSRQVKCRQECGSPSPSHYLKIKNQNKTKRYHGSWHAGDDSPRHESPSRMVLFRLINLYPWYPASTLQSSSPWGFPSLLSCDRSPVSHILILPFFGHALVLVGHIL